jgi:hypothetical protein
MKTPSLDIIFTFLAIFLAVYGLLYWLPVLAQLAGLLVIICVVGVLGQGLIDMFENTPGLAVVLVGSILLGSYLIYN